MGTGSSIYNISIGSNLANNQQYTVRLTFFLGVINLYVLQQSVIKYSATVANSTFNSNLLSAVISSTDLLVGQNFTGCLFYGPGVNFALALVAANVAWNTCPLQTRSGCSEGKDHLTHPFPTSIKVINMTTHDIEIVPCH